MKHCHWLLPALLTTLLIGCAGNPPPRPPPPSEQQTLDRSARLAFDQGQYQQAATLYAAALEQALAEDNAQAIVDARFNLAVSQTYLGQYQQALGQLEQAGAERQRRGLSQDPQLRLLQAIIDFRRGAADHSLSTLEELLAEPAPGAATRAKAHFLSGLIAAERKDTDSLRDHLKSLQAIAQASPVDRLELAGQLAALQGETDLALRQLDQAVLTRATQRDYRGMVRTLAAAGRIAEQSGRDRLAADYLLRAGRSAAQRKAPEAAAWLESARDIGQRIGEQALVLEATQILQALQRSTEN